MDLLKEIRKNKFKELKTVNGVIQIQDLKVLYKGKKMFIGQYLHTIFPPLVKDDYAAFVNELGINIHKSMKLFLEKYNGIILFSDSIAIYGFGRIKVDGKYLTSRNPQIPLPFHLFDENNGKINPVKLKIGSVCEKPLFMDNNTGIITYQNNDRSEQWNNIEDCLDDLFTRVGAYYDENGFCNNPIVIDDLLFNKLKNI